jgi:germination protein M
VKKFVCFLVVIIMGLSLCGCSLIEQLQDWKNGTENQSNQPADDNNASGAAADKLIIDLQDDSVTLTEENSREVVLFFADADGKKLKKELRNILRNESPAQGTINQLIKGPTKDSLTATLPSGTILRSMKIKDGLCTIDFSSELTANYSGGLEKELLTVYSIVNTLTQFSSVNKVQILVDGGIVKTLGGHVDISQPLERNSDLIGD